MISEAFLEGFGSSRHTHTPGGALRRGGGGRGVDLPLFSTTEKYQPSNFGPNPLRRLGLGWVRPSPCTVLHCTVLYYTVMSCPVLYCTALYCQTILKELRQFLIVFFNFGFCWSISETFIPTLDFLPILVICRYIFAFLVNFVAHFL